MARSSRACWAWAALGAGCRERDGGHVSLVHVEVTVAGWIVAMTVRVSTEMVITEATGVLACDWWPGRW